MTAPGLAPGDAQGTRGAVVTAHLFTFRFPCLTGVHPRRHVGEELRKGLGLIRGMRRSLTDDQQHDRWRRGGRGLITDADGAVERGRRADGWGER